MDRPIALRSNTIATEELKTSEIFLSRVHRARRAEVFVIIKMDIGTVREV